MLPAFTCMVKTELKTRGSPISPDCTTSMRGRGSRPRSAAGRRSSASRRRARAARIIASQSCSVTASGFSHSTWTPARAARSVYSRCRWLGSAMYTASMPLCRHSSNCVVAVAARWHAVALPELAQLGRRRRRQRRQLRVARRVREGGQHRDLRDVAEADDGVADLASAAGVVVVKIVPCLERSTGGAARGGIGYAWPAGGWEAIMNKGMLVIVAAALVLPAHAAAADGDVEAVKAVVKSAYVDGVHAKRDAALMRAGFHPALPHARPEGRRAHARHPRRMGGAHREGRGRAQGAARPEIRHEFTQRGRHRERGGRAARAATAAASTPSPTTCRSIASPTAGRSCPRSSRRNR